jgi:hypothetical protein
MDYGLWTMDYGLWTMDYGLWTTVYGLWSMDSTHDALFYFVKKKNEVKGREALKERGGSDIIKKMRNKTKEGNEICEDMGKNRDKTSAMTEQKERRRNRKFRRKKQGVPSRYLPVAKASTSQYLLVLQLFYSVFCKERLTLNYPLQSAISLNTFNLNLLHVFRFCTALC